MLLEEIIMETWPFQMLSEKAYNMAYEKGYKRGFEIGYKKEVLEAYREVLAALTKGRFPDFKLQRLARGMAAIIDKPQILLDLIVKIGIAQSTEEAFEALLGWSESEPDE